VAVLDTGVDLEHPDLKDKIWTNAREDPPNGLDDDENGCADDLHGCNFLLAPPSTDPATTWPGTMVAGMIGARSNNGEGVGRCGWGVTLLPVKVLDSSGAGTSSDVAQGIIYAAKSGAQIIKHEHGPIDAEPGPGGGGAGSPRQVWGHPGQRRRQRRPRGRGYPAAYRQVIAVGSFDHENLLRAPPSATGGRR